MLFFDIAIIKKVAVISKCLNTGAGSKLKEANDQQQFNRNVEDIEVWLGEIEGQLMSEDYGKASSTFIAI